MAKPSGSSPSVPSARPTSSSTPRPAIRPADGLDAGDQVALAGDDVARAAAVPGVAVVEDVAEAVPLRRGLQRHGDRRRRRRRCRAGSPGCRARRRGRCRAWCAPGWCGAASPSAGRSCRSDCDREKRRAAADQRRALAPLGVVEEVQRAEDVVGAPAAPVGARAWPRRRWRPRGRCGRAVGDVGHVSARSPTRVSLGKMRCLMPGINRVDTGRGEPGQPGPEPAGVARRPAPGAQRHPGRGADGPQPAGAVGVAGPAAPALRRRAAQPGRQRVPADPARGAAAGPGAAGAVRGRAGVHRPDRSSTRRPRRGSSRCWSATTSSPSSATRSPRCWPRRRRTRGCGCTANTPAAVDRADQILLSTDLLVLPHGFVTDLSHQDLYRDEWVCVVVGRQPGRRGRADRRAPARRCPGWSPSTARRRPRPPRGRCGCAASSRTSRSSPRTS